MPSDISQDMTSSLEYLYKSTEYVHDFSTKLNAQRSTSSFCDVVLVAEGVEFPAHRSVLAAGSDYFDVMFNINMTESTQSRIHMSGISSDALSNVLDYIYTGALHITEDSIVDLIFLSSLLMLFDVTECCWEYFLKTLHVQNCIERKMFADSVSSEEVSERVTAFILENFTRLDPNSIKNCPMWVMSELFSREELSVEKELDVFHAFLQWSTNNLVEKERFAVRLLDSIRFGFLFLTREALENLLGSYGIARESLIYDSVLSRAEKVTGLSEARLSYKNERVVAVVGGHSESSILNDVSAYIPSCDKWCELSGMNYQRRSFGLVAVNDDLFAVGGTMERAVDRPVPFVERYNAREDTWEEIYVTSTSELEREHAAIVGFRGNIVLSGGFELASGALVSSVIELNTANGDWRRLASLKTAREDHAVVANEKSIYVIGGKNQSGVLDSVERYDLESETWCVLEPMNVRRHNACAAWFDEKLFVFGGYDGQTVLKSVEAYQPDAGRWQLLPDMLTSRMKFGVSVFDDHAYVIGGISGSRGPMVAEVEKYSFWNSSWSSVSPMEGRKMEMNCAVVNVPFKFLK